MKPFRLPIILVGSAIVACISQGAHALPQPAPAPARTPKAAPARFLKIGRPAPRFRIRALDGALVRLDRLAYPGRSRRYNPKGPVLIDFFRTDCKPCIDALPQLVALHDKHSPNGLKVLMVALLEKDRGEEKLQAFLAENRVPFIVVKDITEHVAEKFMGERTALPATFLVDRNGVLRKTKFSAKGSLEAHLGDSLTAVMQEHAAANRK